MPTQAGKDAARRAVLAAMSHKGWNPAKLATEARIDYGTAGDFLNGRRWPKIATLGRIDAALGWTPGTLAGIGEGVGVDAEQQPAPANGNTLMFRRPAGLSDEEWSAVAADMVGGWEWEIAKAVRERVTTRGPTPHGGIPSG